MGENAPFYLSLIASALLLATAYQVLRWYKLSPRFIFCVLLVLIFFTPLPTLIGIGSEHPLHAALTVLLTFLAARLLSAESPFTSRRDLVLLLALAPLVTLVRYEGMFLILAIGALFFLRGRWRDGLLVGLTGFSSSSFTGLSGLRRGGPGCRAPFSGRVIFPSFASLGVALDSVFGPAYANIKAAPHLVVLVASILFLCLYAFDRRPTFWHSRHLMTAIFVLIALAHLQFCAVALFFRYESYLVALGTVVLGVLLAEQLPQKILGPLSGGALVPKHAFGLLLAAFLIYPCAVRAVAALVFLPRASLNIFEQQYQMGLFIRRYYQGSSIALNDIGAVNFLADVHCLDLWGLANYEVTQLARRHQYHTGDILRLSQAAGVKIAIVYDSWYGGEIGGLPRDWVWVGQWTVPDNVVAGGDTISIYAVDEAETASLIEKLKDFSPFLPSGVRQNGRYLY